MDLPVDYAADYESVPISRSVASGLPMDPGLYRDAYLSATRRQCVAGPSKLDGEPGSHEPDGQLGSHEPEQASEEATIDKCDK